MATGVARAQVSVGTYHDDNLRTGWNAYESALTRNAVVHGSFGILRVVSGLDGQIDAQPLIAAGQAIEGGTHDAIYVATENDSIYAVDTTNGKILLHRQLGVPVSATNFFGCDIDGPTVGIDSTPVMDPARGLLYAVAYTWENNAPVYRLHALSLATLADAVAPAVVSASGVLTNGSTYQFNPEVSRQPAALLLANGTVYAGFGSWCDIAANQTRGWVLGWSSGTLAPLPGNKLTDTRSSSRDNYFLTSVWMSGFGLAASAEGSVYFVTGNSDYDGKSYNKLTDIAESAVEMSSDLSRLIGLFTPPDHSQLDKEDADFGAGGLMLLPPQRNGSLGLAVAAGKDGNLYLLDAHGLKKKYGTWQIGGCWCGPSSYVGSDGVARVVASGGTTVGVWAVEPGRKPKLALKASWGGIANGQYPGFFTSITSNGLAPGTSIIWAVGRPTDASPANVDLYAIDPDSGALLFSAPAGRWPNTAGNSNIVPVVANGHVYVASDQMLTIFGLGAMNGPALPSVAATRVPLAKGEYEIYGRVENITGSAIGIRLRGGDKIRLDAADAIRNFRFAKPQVAHALVARGSYDINGIFHADTVLHAKDRPSMWPPDR